MKDKNKIDLLIEEVFNDTIKEENENKELFENRYKDCFNAILFNGEKWDSDQNLYSGLKEFQVIDKLVYIICDFCLMYYNKTFDNNDNICYLLYDENLYKIEKVYGQGSFSRITLLGRQEDRKELYDIELNDVIKWINKTDEWRMFQKKK